MNVLDSVFFVKLNNHNNLRVHYKRGLPTEAEDSFVKLINIEEYDRFKLKEKL